MTYSCSVSTFSKSVSSDTPRQLVPSFDQCVTQWMSVDTSSIFNAMNSSQFHVFAPDSVRIVNSHSAVSTAGVGPADSTGKSRTSVCPGGRFSSRSRLRPPNPLVMNDMALLPTQPTLVTRGRAVTGEVADRRVANPFRLGHHRRTVRAWAQ